jgi:hypothetical protein
MNEHKTYITDTLNNWCENNKSKFNLSQFSLAEGKHYFISIQRDASGAFKCDIKCCCEKRLSLTLRRGKFQISNFYRHLLGLRNGNQCNAMKEMINNPQPISSSTNNQASSTASNYLPQQASPSNSAPVVSLLTTVPSNVTSSASSNTSMPINDDDSNRKQSSLLPSNTNVKRKVQTIESSQNARESAKRTRRR